jgi:fructose/tagatose bisphosphate aldolase
VFVLRGTTAYVENVAATRRAADWAHERGLFIEAELGQVGGKDGVRLGAHEPGARTDPEEAAQYIEATGVDALAVAVSSSHAMTTRKAGLDFDLIARLHAAVGPRWCCPAHPACPTTQRSSRAQRPVEFSSQSAGLKVLVEP